MAEDRRTIRKADWVFRAIVVLLGSGVITMGWYVRDFVDNKLAAASDVTKLQVEVAFLLDRQAEWLSSRIGALEAREQKTEREREQLARFRGLLKGLHVVRDGHE